MKARENTWIDYTLMSALLLLLAGGVMIAILLSRENSRMNTCQKNMQDISKHMVMFSERDASKRLCSGAFSLRTDGCPDVRGWVGDIIAVGAPKNVTMCPANPHMGNESLNELVGYTEIPGQTLNQAYFGVREVSISTGFCKPFIIQLQTISANPVIYDNPNGTMLPGSNARIAVVQDAISQGFNTNYSQSWFAARSNVHLMRGGTNFLFTQGNQTQLSGGMSGVVVRSLEKSDFATSTIPLLGDGAFSLHEARAAVDLNRTIPIGSELVQSFGRGPVEYNPKTQTFDLMSDIATFSNKIPIKELLRNDVLPLPDEEGFGGVDIDQNGLEDPLSFAPNSYGGDDGRLILQDTRNYFSVHRPFQKNICNVLMADGAVKQIHDLNGDGYINPGFNIQPLQPGQATSPKSVRYTKAQCEVGPAEMFSGPMFDLSPIKSMRCFAL